MENHKRKAERLLLLSGLLGALLITGALAYPQPPRETPNPQGGRAENTDIVLPVRWGDLKGKMVEAGVIDKEKIGDVETLPILTVLWALGLGTKNEILEQGPMSDPRYGSPARFASTGGWTLARGDAMEHYSRHPFIVLTPEQQELVARVSKNIYRPCCANPAHFPDCNHGMAMLGLLELLASQDANEAEMYRIALEVNSAWFPDTYRAIAKYLESRGTAWENADPKELLGYEFSSAAGYRQVVSELSSPDPKSAPGWECS
ncbi:hypothetical protein HYW30_02010 [Candidatus Azambacteria bacterium]|nr:hypothetical protein [Candidatus Azambacteria bacterium]